MKLTANTIIKLFVNSVGQDALKDFYEHNWDARKKEIQKLSKAEYDFDLIHLMMSFIILDSSILRFKKTSPRFQIKQSSGSASNFLRIYSFI